jgi:predicted nucleic acid-binding protein
VKFWDTAALVPLIVDESPTGDLRRLLASDRDVVIWMFTRVELFSSLGRLGRTTPDLDDVLPGARADVSDLLSACTTVTDVDGVGRRAERLVGMHPLSAADAMQLAAALVASGDRPESLEFVTLDQALARSARLEGFRVLPDDRRGRTRAQ